MGVAETRRAGLAAEGAAIGRALRQVKALRREKLGSATAVVWLALRERVCAAGGVACFSARDVAEEIGTDPRRVADAIAHLVGAKLLSIYDVTPAGVHRFSLVGPAESESVLRPADGEPQRELPIVEDEPAGVDADEPPATLVAAVFGAGVARAARPVARPIGPAAEARPATAATSGTGLGVAGVVAAWPDAGEQCERVARLGAYIGEVVGDRRLYGHVAAHVARLVIEGRLPAADLDGLLRPLRDGVDANGRPIGCRFGFFARAARRRLGELGLPWASPRRIARPVP